MGALSCRYSRTGNFERVASAVLRSTLSFFSDRLEPQLKEGEYLIFLETEIEVLKTHALHALPGGWATDPKFALRCLQCPSPHAGSALLHRGRSGRYRYLGILGHQFDNQETKYTPSGKYPYERALVDRFSPLGRL